MTGCRALLTDVAVCFSRGADIGMWRIPLRSYERVHLRRTLSMLVEFGHVAAFSVAARRSCSWDEFLGALGDRCGENTVSACLTTPAARVPPAPSIAVPVGAFDHVVDGAPASTAQFLGLDLELTATPSFDEELGAFLPGLDGRWLIHARPLSS